MKNIFENWNIHTTVMQIDSYVINFINITDVDDKLLYHEQVLDDVLKCLNQQFVRIYNTIGNDDDATSAYTRNGSYLWRTI